MAQVGAVFFCMRGLVLRVELGYKGVDDAHCLRAEGSGDGARAKVLLVADQCGFVDELEPVERRPSAADVGRGVGNHYAVVLERPGFVE